MPAAYNCFALGVSSYAQTNPCAFASHCNGNFDVYVMPLPLERAVKEMLEEIKKSKKDFGFFLNKHIVMEEDFL